MDPALTARAAHGRIGSRQTNHHVQRNRTRPCGIVTEQRRHGAGAQQPKGASMFAKSLVLSLGIAAATLVGCANAGETAQSGSAVAPAHQVEKTSPFRGVKANTGYATLTHVDGKRVLAVSDDFVIPNTPAPSWQIVDSSGNVYI